jgi:hypothetical protein
MVQLVATLNSLHSQPLLVAVEVAHIKLAILAAMVDQVVVVREAQTA